MARVPKRRGEAAEAGLGDGEMQSSSGTTLRCTRKRRESIRRCARTREREGDQEEAARLTVLVVNDEIRRQRCGTSASYYGGLGAR